MGARDERSELYCSFGLDWLSKKKSNVEKEEGEMIK